MRTTLVIYRRKKKPPFLAAYINAGLFNPTFHLGDVCQTDRDNNKANDDIKNLKHFSFLSFGFMSHLYI